MGFVLEDYDYCNPAYGIKGNMTLDRNGRHIYDYYEEVEQLGAGAVGTVSCVRQKQLPPKNFNCVKGCGWLFNQLALSRKRQSIYHESKSESFFALKSIQIHRIYEHRLHDLRNEIDILKALDHPNIVRAYDVFESRREIYIIMEKCSGGDLSSRLPYKEHDVSKILNRILSALVYMHDKGVVHRDLKFANILFENDSPEAEIKIIDFGLAKKFSPEESIMNRRVGTLYTMAPEVIEGLYTSQADMWSVGVITFMLLANAIPFYDRSNNRKTVIDKIMRCDYNFNDAIWEEISKEGKDFVRCLIHKEPDIRLNAREAQQHTWQLSGRSNHPSALNLEKLHDNMLTYIDSSELKKITLMFVAHISQAEEIIELRDLFYQYDTDRNGCLSLREFKNSLQALNYSDELINDMFREVDVGGDGLIFYTEFIAATLESLGVVEEDRLLKAFDRIDRDNTGYITRKNLRQLLGKGYTAEKVEKLIEQVDEKGDGKISYDEYLKVFNNQTRKERNSIVVQMEDELKTVPNLT